MSSKHYQDVAIFAEKINPELPATTTQQVQQQSRMEQLEEQLRQHQEQMEEMRKLLQDRDNLKSGMR